MLSRLEQAQQKWGGSHSVIDNWLMERQELLLLYYKVAGLSPFESSDKALPEQVQIQSFCQILMDYLSAGHFEVYDNIVAACKEKGPESLKLAQSIYPKITASTDLALDFNDKYAEANSDNPLADFDKDLSTLGEALEQRFGLEDELIDNLFANHTD
ncbi:Rsd/AlgQ family anti-sigma factor [Pseudoalteromonas luteoviolacea]|uniref:Anti-RNA polymerase sigma 70 factor n=1 Tax=Pseudoalteromonas luteoviolacea H33 TaxID=1365251 RepID=A0A167ED13_9GAMM|nr:Rsd/AlgQ family anti-sigma factor [Pseudoalteromonas luteoviolacea]KZN50413.1 anti-RNA polymerase sigma 70 factor [Pseudoalteromonas luteoviolacea H33]KZN77938.1 anti-RNA polymerase sigma 70 factor [Pseudoalteromonas luteoviolacea H33-S]MBQ4879499.1 Rsd/AlgQ family anti-sigma factor [Pseudoalteromonas luteoviolacea]MBQ4908574.1 Rsd/AlgQ family anti-sigma factor [Pseudoalteromonas luteoviolacea]